VLRARVRVRSLALRHRSPYLIPFADCARARCPPRGGRSNCGCDDMSGREYHSEAGDWSVALTDVWRRPRLKAGPTCGPMVPSLFGQLESEKNEEPVARPRLRRTVSRYGTMADDLQVENDRLIRSPPPPSRRSQERHLIYHSQLQCHPVCSPFRTLPLYTYCSNAGGTCCFEVNSRAAAFLGQKKLLHREASSLIQTEGAVAAERAEHVTMDLASNACCAVGCA
jgi:hypothetical protein